MKAIICGTGLAGLALAVRLGRAGWEVLLLEPDPQAPKAGYLVDVSGPGFSAAQWISCTHLRMSAMTFPGWSGWINAVRLCDACQASSVVAGRGASLALHPACVLADELDSKEHMAVALERYEQRLKPTILQTQERRRRAAQWFVPSSWLRLGARNAAIRLLDHCSLSWLLRPLLA